MEKRVADLIQEQMSPQNQANRMKEGRPSIVDEIAREIDLTEKPRHPSDAKLTGGGSWPLRAHITYDFKFELAKDHRHD